MVCATGWHACKLAFATLGADLGGSLLPELGETSTEIEVVDLNLNNENDDEATLEREKINHNDNRSGSVGSPDGIMIHVQPDNEIPDESVEFGNTLRNSNFGLFRTSTLSKTSTVSKENLPHLCLMLPLTRIWKSLQKSPSHRIFALQYLSDISGDYQAHWTLHTLRYKLP